VRRFALFRANNALIALKMLRSASSHAILRLAQNSLDRRLARVSGLCSQALISMVREFQEPQHHAAEIF